MNDEFGLNRIYRKQELDSYAAYLLGEMFRILLKEVDPEWGSLVLKIEPYRPNEQWVDTFEARLIVRGVEKE